jgi:Mg2+-importing ATPase
LGNEKLMEKVNVVISDELKKQVSSEQKLGKTISYLSEDNKAIGFVVISDRIKESSKEAIYNLQKEGLKVIMFTGDNEETARSVSKSLNLDGYKAQMLPAAKLEEIKRLQAEGKKVAMAGDGINDAAALRDADVGISVDTAVDIAKESADIILLEKDLMVLRKGVIYGRRTFGNIIKYIKMTASSNFGNMFSMLGASAFLPFLPMLPVQLLVQNLLYDISQTSIPWDWMDADFLEEPKKWDASGISKFMLYIGPISSIFDYATFAIMFFLFKANDVAHQSLFQSGWFI